MEEKGELGEEVGCVDGWMVGWMDRLSGVCKQFAMATLAEPIICQRLSEYIRKGDMDGKWLVRWQQSLTQQRRHKT